MKSSKLYSCPCSSFLSKGKTAAGRVPDATGHYPTRISCQRLRRDRKHALNSITIFTGILRGFGWPDDSRRLRLYRHSWRFRVPQMSAQPERAILPPPREGVDCLSVLDADSAHSHHIPSSNTGCISLIDYLTVSVSLLVLGDISRATLGEANKALKHVMPDSSLLASDFEDKGFLGYRYSADIFGPACEQPCGKIAFGGNNNTLMISVTGAGCPFLGDLSMLAHQLEHLAARITRVDLAFDDFEGEYLDIAWIGQLSQTGFFDSTYGQKSRRKKIDDLGTLAGCSIYHGRKGDKELCIYEKGKQLQDARSSWVRCEVRLWSKNRIIPYQVLVNGGAFMRGAFPQLSSFLPIKSSSRSENTKRSTEASARAQAAWLENAAGRTLGLLQRSMQPAQLDVFLQTLGKTGLPKRFKSMPGNVVEFLIQAHANKETLPC